jgi:hypothetical protein
MPNDSPGHLFRNIMGIPEFGHRLSVLDGIEVMTVRFTVAMTR